MFSKSPWLKLLLLCLQSRFAVCNVLELPTCSRGAVTKDITIAANSSMITQKSNARSLAECVTNCMMSYPVRCNSAFKDKTSNLCYEMNGHETTTNRSDDQMYRIGNLVEVMTTGKREDCGGRQCPKDQVCMVGCAGEELVPPVCLADQRIECDLMNEYGGIRHYWSDEASDARDNGVIMYATYPKQSSSSGLRVSINMIVRGQYMQQDACSRWYLNFNGDECRNPATIELVVYAQNSQSFHHAIDIDGTCYGIASGDVLIELVVQNTCGGRTPSDPQSGWKSARTMVVMEVTSSRHLLQTNIHKSCPQLNVFNYDYQTWREQIDVTTNLKLGGLLINKINYEKFADDTSLRIKYSAVTTVVNYELTRVFCARWYVKINGAECTPTLDYIIYADTPSQLTYWEHFSTGRTAEGICDNALPAGIHSIEIWVGRCVGVQTDQPTRTISGDFDSPSRLHIEEVRRDHVTDGVLSKAETYRSHTGKISRHFWLWSLPPFGNQGEIAYLTYYKEFGDTALRLTASGVHKIESIIGNGLCGRWYFMIDGSECTTPGRIEGVTFIKANTNYHHPKQVSGLCLGISKGDHMVSYMAIGCLNQDMAIFYTGFASSFHIFVEELRIESSTTCSGLPVNCDIPLLPSDLASYIN